MTETSLVVTVTVMVMRSADCFKMKKDETELPCQSNKNYEFVFDLTDEDDEMNEASDCFSERYTRGGG